MISIKIVILVLIVVFKEVTRADNINSCKVSYAKLLNLRVNTLNIFKWTLTDSSKCFLTSSQKRSPIHRDLVAMAIPLPFERYIEHEYNKLVIVADGLFVDSKQKKNAWKKWSMKRNMTVKIAANCNSNSKIFFLLNLLHGY